MNLQFGYLLRWQLCMRLPTRSRPPRFRAGRYANYVTRNLEQPPFDLSPAIRNQLFGAGTVTWRSFATIGT